MNPAKVDVNVHPAKLEVRFEDESKIFQSIYHSIKDTLLKGELVANTDKQELEQKPEEQSKGLYDFRKNETQKIEAYTNEESKIKTNNIVQDVYTKSNYSVNTTPHINLGEGGPINTADVLEQLKQLQDNIQKEVETSPEIKLNENYVKMREEEIQKQQKEEEKIEETKEEKGQEAENEKIEENKEIEENEEQSEIPVKVDETDEKNNESTEKEKIETEKTDKKEESTEIKSQNFDEMYTKLFGTKPINNESTQTEEKTNDLAVDLLKDNISVFDQKEEYQKTLYKFIGIAFNTYIIIEMDKEMYIIDQHAAHERIMYEKVKDNYYSESTKDSQMLLLPDVITLTHKEMEIAKENMDMFEKAGFSLEEFGENTIKLTGVPTVCIDLDNKELFLETLDEINTVARTAKQEKFIATVACKAAVKANMVLTREEVESLMDKLLALPNPFTCPHGRPTAIKMSKYDIERKFARK